MGLDKNEEVTESDNVYTLSSIVTDHSCDLRIVGTISCRSVNAINYA